MSKQPSAITDRDSTNKDTVDKIAISEIFGPTVQGEGSLIGTPCVFVRTGGCDFRCQWCDTPHAVLPEHASTWRKMTSEAIVARVNECAQPPILITLSGGNPALQPCAGLIELGRAQGYSFALETQGSVIQPWFADLDLLTLSPKPPSANVPFSSDMLAACLAFSEVGVAVNIKCVIMDETDYNWARALAVHYPNIDFFLQPVGLVDDTLAEQVNRLDWLISKTLADGWYWVRVLPQLHTWLWGNAPGR